MQADYVKALLLSRELASLRSSAPSIAVVSSSSAASLLAASKDLGKVLEQLTQLEGLLGLQAEARHLWVPGQADFDKGLAELKEREIQR